LDSIATISIGEFVHKNKQTPDGQYPVYNGGTSNTGFYTEYNQTANKIIISARGAAGFVNKIEVPYWAGNSCYSIDIIDKNTNWYFVYYYLKSIEKKIVGKQQKGCIPAVSKKQVQELQIPLPPLAVQSEIVRILDKFTLYKSELAAELAARLQQYEYYRDKLFTFGDDVERKTLGEIGTFTRGRRFCRTDIVDEGQSCIHYGDIYTYYGLNTTTTKTHLPYDFPVKLRYAEKGDVVIVGAGENDMDIGVGVVWEGNDSVAVHDACYIFKHNMNPRYISHYLRTINYHLQIKKYVNRGKICSISAEGIAKAVIPIPSLAEQERIASILDRFDKLCHDIREGLPAEIDLRQKQYEHYRDKLLTFEAKG
jgi:type I restriction enzyme S subunit